MNYDSTNSASTPEQALGALRIGDPPPRPPCWNNSSGEPNKDLSVYISRFKNGEKVWFKVYQDSKTAGWLAKVAGVRFVESKVLYDLVLSINGEFHEAYPIREVDSIFVAPYEGI